MLHREFWLERYIADEGVLGFLKCPSSERERGYASSFIPSPANPHVLAITWAPELTERGDLYIMEAAKMIFIIRTVACKSDLRGRMDVFCFLGIQAAHDPFPDLLRLSCGSG